LTHHKFKARVTGEKAGPVQSILLVREKVLLFYFPFAFWLLCWFVEFIQSSFEIFREPREFYSHSMAGIIFIEINESLLTLKSILRPELKIISCIMEYSVTFQPLFGRYSYFLKFVKCSRQLVTWLVMDWILVKMPRGVSLVLYMGKDGILKYTRIELGLPK